MVKVKARTIQDKEARRQAILGAAAVRFERERFEAMTMAQLAEDAGLAKGTVYLYFRTKEEVFLALAEESLELFFRSLDAGLASGRLFFGPEELATLVTRLFREQPRLPRLLGLLHPVLEYNVDRARALDFRTFLADHYKRTGKHLEQRLPSLRDGEGVVLLSRLHALAIGCWQVTDTSPILREVLEERKFKLFKNEFEPLFSKSLSALIAGMEEQSRRKK